MYLLLLPLAVMKDTWWGRFNRGISGDRENWDRGCESLRLR